MITKNIIMYIKLNGGRQKKAKQINKEVVLKDEQR